MRCKIIEKETEKMEGGAGVRARAGLRVYTWHVWVVFGCGCGCGCAYGCVCLHVRVCIIALICLHTAGGGWGGHLREPSLRQTNRSQSVV
jgi:hypothetical protein